MDREEALKLLTGGPEGHRWRRQNSAANPSLDNLGNVNLSVAKPSSRRAPVISQLASGLLVPDVRIQR